MIHDIDEYIVDHPHLFESLKNNAKKLLYVSSKFTNLSAVLRLYNLKVENGWSDKSFTSLLKLLKDMLSWKNELSDRMYEPKKIMRSMRMNYEEVHACPNDCILYQKDYEHLEKCPVCGRSRYKTNDKSMAKVLWYFSIILKFKCISKNAEYAKNLT